MIIIPDFLKLFKKKEIQPEKIDNYDYLNNLSDADNCIYASILFANEYNIPYQRGTREIALRCDVPFRLVEPSLTKLINLGLVIDAGERNFFACKYGTSVPIITKTLPIT